MSWTWKKIIGFGIVAFLVATLLLDSSTGLITKEKNLQTTANNRIDNK
ncbi:hypothetical protein [Paenibacillus sp. yr247]|nr:hypothetical protein [Paenibacillus sp. yr247]